MSNPEPGYPQGLYQRESPSSTIVGIAALPPQHGMSYATGTGSNTKAFLASFKASQYKTLQDFMYDKQKLERGASKDCGFSDPSVKKPLPDVIEWGHGEGFTDSHEGPCEVWCDDEMVLYEDNCAKKFSTRPATQIPYDKSKCVGKKQLKVIWFALHTPIWQVYTNCVGIESDAGTGAGAGGATSLAPSAGANGDNDGASAPAGPTSTPPSQPSQAPPTQPTQPTNPVVPSYPFSEEMDCEEITS